jgi:CMP-N,N'-diacetyllegionaminic acid synthase
MKTLGIIPARGGSKGIPKKNIKLLNGKPLIAYTLEAALSSTIDRVVVSTDCQEIAQVAKQFGVEVIIRPSELAKDSTPTLPVLQHIVNNINETFDAVVTLQPTSPLRVAKHINEAIELFKNDDMADSLVSVIEVPHNYMPEKLMDIKGKYLVGNSEAKRRQEINRAYARNGAAIYITKASRLDKYIFGGNILPYFMSKINSIDVDYIEDWEIVECLLKNRH